MSENTENTAETAPESHAEATESADAPDPPAETAQRPTEAADSGSREEAAPAADEPPGGSEAERLSRWPSRYRDAYRSLDQQRVAEVEAAQQETARVQELLDAERDRLIAVAITQSGYSPALFDAGRLTHADVLGEDGLVDRGVLEERISTLAKELGVQPRSRRPRPVPHAGTGGDRYIRAADAVRGAFGVE